MISLLKTKKKRERKNTHYTSKFIKNQHNRFPFERVEDVGPLPGASQNHPLPLLLPPQIQIEDDLLNAMIVLAPHGEMAKLFLW